MKTTPAAELKELLLRAPRRTIAAAESLTAGHVQARIAAVSGASLYFLGGLTAYSLDEKVKLLGVDREAAAGVDCVSAAVAGQMARGVCALFGADVGVATTGYAEPAPAAGVTVPFAWWAVAVRTESGRFQSRHGRIECPGASRTAVQAIVADAVLAETVDFLREWRGTGPGRRRG